MEKDNTRKGGGGGLVLMDGVMLSPPPRHNDSAKKCIFHFFYFGPQRANMDKNQKANVVIIFHLRYGVYTVQGSPTTRSLEVKGKWNVLRGPPYYSKMTIARQTYLREIKRQIDRYIDRQTVGYNSQKDRYVLHRLRKR